VEKPMASRRYPIGRNKTLNQRVPGSSPGVPTKSPSLAATTVVAIIPMVSV
jgi:hypothetical protein